MTAPRPTKAQLTALRLTAKHPGWRWTSPVNQPRAATLDACHARGWLAGGPHFPEGVTLTDLGRAALDGAKGQD